MWVFSCNSVQLQESIAIFSFCCCTSSFIHGYFKAFDRGANSNKTNPSDFKSYLSRGCIFSPAGVSLALGHSKAEPRSPAAPVPSQSCPFPRPSQAALPEGSEPPRQRGRPYPRSGCSGTRSVALRARPGRAAAGTRTPHSPRGPEGPAPLAPRRGGSAAQAPSRGAGAGEGNGGRGAGDSADPRPAALTGGCPAPLRSAQGLSAARGVSCSGRRPHFSPGRRPHFSPARPH